MFATADLQKQYALLTNQGFAITTKLCLGLVWLEWVNCQLIGVLVCDR